MIWCDYQESVIIENIENYTEEIEYLDGLIPFRAELIEGKSSRIEKIAGIKEVEYTKILKIEKNTQTDRPIRFKRNDRIFVFEKEYIVVDVGESIPNKFKGKVSRNQRLYERYVDYVVFIK